MYECVEFNNLISKKLCKVYINKQPELATVKGYVTIRWYGESNGYYSESVNFKIISSQK